MRTSNTGSLTTALGAYLSFFMAIAPTLGGHPTSAKSAANLSEMAREAADVIAHSAVRPAPIARACEVDSPNPSRIGESLGHKLLVADVGSRLPDTPYPGRPRERHVDIRFSRLDRLEAQIDRIETLLRDVTQPRLPPACDA
jgi:hypothetical protein